METDRNVADYMQIRNLLSLNAARVLAAQLLLIAVFFCAYLFLQNTDRFAVSLHNMRIVVKSTLIIISLMIALCSTIVMNHARKLFKTIPDDIGIRQSREIVEEAYSVARGALTFKMTLAGLILAIGIFASLILATVIANGEAGTYFSKALFFVTLACAALLFIPSFDRMNVYKTMLGMKHNIIPDKTIVFSGTLAGILMPLSVAVYLFWRYFGANRTIAWIVFPAAVIVLGAAQVLFLERRHS